LTINIRIFERLLFTRRVLVQHTLQAIWVFGLI
jgi:hypothetical protein